MREAPGPLSPRPVPEGTHRQHCLLHLGHPPPPHWAQNLKHHVSPYKCKMLTRPAPWCRTPPAVPLTWLLCGCPHIPFATAGDPSAEQSHSCPCRGCLPSVSLRQRECQGQQAAVGVHTWHRGVPCLWVPEVPGALPLVTSAHPAPPLQRWGGPRREPDGGRLPG